MIRILHMIGSLNVGGSQTMIMNIYRKINRNEIQFDFIIDRPNELYFAEEIKELGGRIYILPTFNGKNIFEIRKSWNGFLTEHTEYKILHSHVRSYASIFIPVAKRHGLKTIIHSHSTSNGKGLSSIGKQILQYPLRYQADYFFGCSRIAGEWLFGNKVVNSDKYFMLQNAVDLDLFSSNKNRDSLRKELGIENEIVFGHVGRFHESKNHKFLISLFNDLRKIYPNSKLLLVGDGSLRNEIESQINEMQLNDSVILAGQHKNVYDYLSVMDCFIFPSNWEGLPVTVVEAQASGLECYISSTITQDVNVSKYVHYLPIDKGISIWTDELKKCNFKRIDVKEDIIKAGFDINESSRKLVEFYKGLNK